MNHIKTLHFADLHLGSEFRALGRQARYRREDLKQTFINIIELCKKERVQLVLAPGDLFESWSIPQEYIDLVADAFSTIPETVVVIAAGNHDPLTIESPYKKEDLWSDNVYILDTMYKSFLIPELNLEVWGAGFGASYQTSSLIKSGSQQNPEYIQIGVLHGDLGAESQSSQYNPITTSQIANSKLDYLALGHIHKPSGVQQAGQTYFAYPGSPEGRGFDELGEHGVLIGEIGKSHCTMEFIPVSQRQYIEHEVDISGISSSREGAQLVIGALKTAYGEGYADNLYKLVLSGKLPGDVNISFESIKGFLNELFYVKLRDKTHLDIDLNMLAGETSLKGVFVRNMLELLSDTDDSEAHQALNLGLKAFLGEVEYVED